MLYLERTWTRSDMRRCIQALLWVSVMLVRSAMGDSPLPAPTMTEVASPNGRFAAISDPKSTTTRVIEVATGRVLWKVPDWFRSMFVSNDGKHLAVGYDGLNLVPLSYVDSMELISFWDQGRKIKSVTLSEIVPDRTVLERTMSHYAWGDIEGVNDKDQLVVRRVDGQIFRFSMATGELE